MNYLLSGRSYRRMGRDGRDITSTIRRICIERSCALICLLTDHSYAVKYYHTHLLINHLLLLLRGLDARNDTQLHGVKNTTEAKTSHCIGVSSAEVIARNALEAVELRGLLHIWARSPRAQQHLNRLDIPKSVEILLYIFGRT